MRRGGTLPELTIETPVDSLFPPVTRVRPFPGYSPARYWLPRRSNLSVLRAIMWSIAMMAVGNVTRLFLTADVTEHRTFKPGYEEIIKEHCTRPLVLRRIRFEKQNRERERAAATQPGAGRWPTLAVLYYVFVSLRAAKIFPRPKSVGRKRIAQCASTWEPRARPLAPERGVRIRARSHLSPRSGAGQLAPWAAILRPLGSLRSTLVAACRAALSPGGCNLNSEVWLLPECTGTAHNPALQSSQNARGRQWQPNHSHTCTSP